MASFLFLRDFLLISLSNDLREKNQPCQPITECIKCTEMARAPILSTDEYPLGRTYKIRSSLLRCKMHEISWEGTLPFPISLVPLSHSTAISTQIWRDQFCKDN